MGQNHIRTYRQMPGVELVGIADINPQILSQLEKQYSTQGFTDYKELLKQDLDAVSIAVPTTLHKKVSLDVIASNTNLLIEKPIADTIANAGSIVAAAHRENLTLVVGHIERYNPAVGRMKKVIDSGELGKVVSISCCRVGPYNPRIRDVGVILDIGVHDIDIISYFYNRSVSEVYTIAGRVAHSYEDYASILLRFDDSKAGVIETNWLTPHKARKFTVIGTEGVGYGDYIAQTVFIHDKDWVKEAKVEKKEPLRCELEGFISACHGDKEPLASGEDGVQALCVAMAAIESYQTNRSVKISTKANTAYGQKERELPIIMN